MKISKMLIVFACFALIACTPAKLKSVPLSGSITFSTHRTDQFNLSVRKIADEFERIHPGVKITVIGQTNAEVEAAFAANELSDVTQINIFSKLGRDTYPNYFLPLDNLGFTAQNLYFYNGGIGEDNKLYAVSNCMNYDGIIYNKELFRKASITVLPKTMDEFFAACVKLKNLGVVPVGIAVGERWTSRWYSEHAYASAFHAVPNYLNTTTKDSYLLKKDEGILNGLDFLRKIVQSGYAENEPLSASWEELLSNMANGKIAMAYFGTWFPPQLFEKGMAEQNIGMFPAPGTEALVTMFDTWYGISKKTKNPELCKAFFLFLFKEDRFANALGIISPSKGMQPNFPFLRELLYSGLPVIEGEGDTVEFQNRYAASGIDLYDIAQEYAITDTPQKIIDRVNKLWADSAK